MKESKPKTQSQNRVLIVDDESVTRKLLASLMAPDAEVVEAKDGEQALNLFRESQDTEAPIKFVLLDVKMPKRDGIDALIAMRTIEEDLNIKEGARAVIVTSHVSKEEIVDARYSGCLEVITKPIDSAWVMSRLREQGFPVRSERR